MCADDKREGDKGTTEDKWYRFIFFDGGVARI